MKRRYTTDAERREAGRQNALAYYYAHREAISDKRRRRHPALAVAHCNAWRVFPVGTTEMVCPACGHTILASERKVS